MAIFSIVCIKYFTYNLPFQCFDAKGEDFCIPREDKCTKANIQEQCQKTCGLCQETETTTEAGGSTTEAEASTTEAGASTTEAEASTAEAGASTTEAGASTTEVGASTAPAVSDIYVYVYV